jgi:hypothetical protein
MPSCIFGVARYKKVFWNAIRKRVERLSSNQNGKAALKTIALNLLRLPKTMKFTMK